jgi:16S rRNA pseudouridine516 synthase
MGGRTTAAPVDGASVPLGQLLFSQGFGSRREVAGLIAAGRVRLDGQVVRDPETVVAAYEGRPFEVDGIVWPYRGRAVVMLHKPAGTECSAAPGGHPSVLGLLPAPLRGRGVQPVGRLDADTTGLLLLTDDGALNHRLTSPRHHVDKTYEVTCTHAVTPEMVAALREGVTLRDDPHRPVRAKACDPTGPASVRLVLDEGRYHQVKRMVAAAGNRVSALHRSRFGPLVLPADLPPGAWRWVEPGELAAAATASVPGR